ncbi:MAG: magnesium and cobalt exporter, family [Pseudonocardiales bacterium]|nr:magnesium and cobalt exporter, family [Pseudonocardiales bacterium]
MNVVLTSLGLVVLFVMIGGFFSGSELAVLTLRDSQVDRLPGRRGQRVRRLRVDPSRFLASVQIGVTFAGFFASAYGGATLSEPLAGVLTTFGMPAGAADSVAFVAVTAFISYLSLVLGELVPKRLALQRAEGIALFVSPVLEVVARISRPVVWLLSVTTNLIVRILGLNPHQGREEVTEEELRDIVSTHRDLDTEERRVLSDVFGAANRQLAEVMVPRTEVEFLAADTPLDEAARQVLDKPHSRYPVIGETVDEVVGVVHLRDLLTNAFTFEGDIDGRTVGDIARPAPLLPGSKPVLAALAEMRADRTHLAVVVDEYGGTDGIVTMEDIIEELVGEIEDEFDPAAVPPVSSEFDGLVHREELAGRTGIVLPDGPYETLGGFVVRQLGRIPGVGDTVEAHGHVFTVVAMDSRRVARIRVAPMAPTPDDERAMAEEA